MSQEFIKNKTGSGSLAKAKRQYRDIMYFVQSEIQQDVSLDYLHAYAQSKYVGSDEFLNWVKTLFKRDNFLSFYKYLRNPLPSAKLIEKDVVPALSRVFYSEDSYFNYRVNGERYEHIDELKSAKFTKDIFGWLLFNYNDVVVVDMEDVNKPVRNLVELKNIVSLDTKNGVINRIAYSAEIAPQSEGEEPTYGYAYVDAQSYKFYDKDFELILESPHDLQECPAYFVSDSAFAMDEVVRKSMFSHVREEFEEYVFLKTLLKMTNVNGVIPIVTKAKTRDRSQNPDVKGASDKQPMTSNEIGSQRSEMQSEIKGSDSILQAGTVVSVPAIKKADGSIDIEAVRNWLNFFHTPVEPMEFIKKRIEEVRDSIVYSLVGNMTEGNDTSKNEMQVKGGFVTAEDRIRMLSREMTVLRLNCDRAFLALKHGKDGIHVDGTYGTDFFLESTQTLYTLFQSTPNVIERKNILVRIAKNRNKHNRERATREVILYSLIPYISDKDFDAAVSANRADPLTFEYQTRFEYWVSMFEATYGDILDFWQAMEGSADAEKQVLINSLIIRMIQDDIAKRQPVIN